MSEKTDIEWATGETFISLYNAERATTYLAQPSEAPDFHCVDQIQERGHSTFLGCFVVG